MQHMFYVVKDMSRNLILGTDWLRQHGVRIYNDLGCMRIENKRYVNLEEDIHVSSVARNKYNTVLKPLSATICYAKVRSNPDLPVRVDYQISAVEKGFTCREPGLEVVDSVSRLGKDRSIPILVTNSTGKFIRIRRHGPIAKVEQLTGQGLAEVISVIKGQKFDSRMD